MTHGSQVAQGMIDYLNALISNTKNDRKGVKSLANKLSLIKVQHQLEQLRTQMLRSYWEVADKEDRIRDQALPLERA